MSTLDAARHIATEMMMVRDEAALSELLHESCRYLSCDFYALSHHIDFLAHPDRGVRLHNYPEEWARWFDQRRLGPSDPVHRASQRTGAAFLWIDIPKFVAPCANDEDILARATRHGIGDGLTIPAHVPGEAHGSCSFAWRHGRTGAELDQLPFAQMTGSFAFEAARRLAAPPGGFRRPRLTDRQRECILWVARGKTDWEIATILGVRHVTVVEHLRNARARYDATSRVTLAVRALFDGLISFGDISND